MLQPTTPYSTTSTPTQRHHLSLFSLLSSFSCSYTPAFLCHFPFHFSFFVFPRKLTHKQCLNTHTHTLAALHVFILFYCHLSFFTPFLFDLFFSPPLSSPLVSSTPFPSVVTPSLIRWDAVQHLCRGFSGSGFVRETPVSLSLPPVLMAD